MEDTGEKRDAREDSDEQDEPKEKHTAFHIIGVMVVFFACYIAFVFGVTFVVHVVQGKSDVDEICFYENKTSYQSSSTQEPVVRRVFVDCP